MRGIGDIKVALLEFRSEMLHLWKARTRSWDIDSIIKLEKLYVHVMSQKVVPRNLEKYPRDPEFRILRRVILKAFLET